MFMVNLIFWHISTWQIEKNVHTVRKLDKPKISKKLHDTCEAKTHMSVEESDFSTVRLFSQGSPNVYDMHYKIT